MYIRTLGEIQSRSALPTFLELAASETAIPLRQAALAMLGRFDSPEIPAALLPLISTAPVEIRSPVLAVLSSRASWSHELLRAVQKGQVPAAVITHEVAEQIRSHPDRDLVQLAARVIPRIEKRFAGADRVRFVELERILKSGQGHPSAGEAIFTERCASCHQLFGRGVAIGPNLTDYQRHDLGTMLESIVNPNAEIREGFVFQIARTHDGRAIGGFLVRNDSRLVVLRGLTGEEVTIARSELKNLERAERSLMPEDLLEGLGAQQLRDFFAYLQRSGPAATRSTSQK